jgi:carbon storage regulator
MLVLTRKSGESVVISQELEVRVLAVHGSRVKLGFSGPPEIAIQRGEICQSVRRSADLRGRRDPRPRYMSSDEVPSTSGIPAAPVLVVEV